MPEPIVPAATVVAGAAVLPVLQAAPAIAPQIAIAGYAIGLRADVLVAGFAGSIVALTFFNSVPSTGDTLRQLIQTTLWRMWWSLASSLTAGYIAPLLLLLEGPRLQIPEQLLLPIAFLVGAGAQRIVGGLLTRAEKRIAAPPGGPPAAAPSVLEEEARNGS